LDILYDYAQPKPFPDDIYLKYHVTNNQAYIMIGNAGTGHHKLMKKVSFERFLALSVYHYRYHNAP